MKFPKNQWCLVILVFAVAAAQSTTLAQSKLNLSSYRLIYVSNHQRPAGNNYNYAIYSKNLKSGATERLTDLNDDSIAPSISANGKRIVYMIYTQGKNADIGIMDSAGKYARVLTENEDWDGLPSLSRDGNKVIYTEKRKGTNRAVVMDIHGRYKRPVTPANYDVSCAVFSPDGNSILFAGSQVNTDSRNYGQHREYPFYGLYKINLDGTRLKKLTSAGNRPTWSHDGKKIAFSNRGICLMNADGSNIQRLTWSGYDDDLASFTPDDNYLVFASTAFSQPGEKRIESQDNLEESLEIYIASLKDKRIKKLNVGRGSKRTPMLVRISKKPQRHGGEISVATQTRGTVCIE